jgi:hypothetical protein
VSLELVGDDDLAEDLKYKKCAAKLRQFCDEELAALDQRVGVLLGDAQPSGGGQSVRAGIDRRGVPEGLPRAR